MTKVESIEGINISVNENQNAFVITNESSNINSEFTHNKIHIDQTTIKNDNIIIQQDNNVSKITNNNISVENNQSEISLEPGKININNNGDTSNIIGSQFSGNAASADKLNTDAGSALHPIYFVNGKPVETTYDLKLSGSDYGIVKTGNNVTISNGLITVNDDEHNHIINNIDGLQEILDNKLDKDSNIDGYLPLSAGEEYKLTGPLGFTNGIGYGASLPSDGFEGQLFFLETLDINSATLSTGETIRANAVYGAVYNDYAEYRAQKDLIQPGYCAASSDDGKIYKTSEKFQACDGIVSDTFGFAIGETEECQIPLAVAGRVLAYCAGNREDYHAGDTVCAGPGGLVYKMTREEIREWPDRIICIVSEIPQYEIWGENNIQVNNRIWIKIK